MNFTNPQDPEFYRGRVLGPNESPFNYTKGESKWMSVSYACGMIAPEIEELRWKKGLFLDKPNTMSRREFRKKWNRK